MKIHVVYKNGQEDMVDPKFLDILLYLGEIQEFRRRDHWVNVIDGPIRDFHQKPFQGSERRANQHAEFISVPVNG